jgi:hypothetical protein
VKDKSPGLIPEHEARRNERLIRKERIEVTVLSCAADPSLDGLKLDCSTLDASASGMRLCLKSAVPHAAVLELGIRMPGGARNLRLHGIVRWVRDRGNDAGYAVGVELRNLPSPRPPLLRRATGFLFKKKSRDQVPDELSLWRNGIFESIRMKNA